MDLDKVVVPVHWYALRVTYCRELVLKSWLDEQGTVNFVPMRYELVEKEGRKSRKLVPAVHNLVFVHTSRRGLESLCSHPELPVPVRYFYSRETRRPLVIPDNQMQNFIAVAGNYEESVLYLDPVDLQLSKGTRVRITGGVFEGVEGVFIRVRHDRRVVVCIEGITAVATTFVPPSLVEPL